MRRYGNKMLVGTVTTRAMLEPEDLPERGVTNGAERSEDSEDIADRVRTQCAERGVDIVYVRARWTTLTKPEHHAPYPVTVFVVPAKTVSRQDYKSKRLVADVIGRYRRHRRDTLGAVIAGRQRYAFAGVLHIVVLVDSPDSKPGPTLMPLLNEACMWYEVEPGTDELPDLFAIFNGSVVPPRIGASATPWAIDHVEVLWAEARAWGATTPEHVHDILDITDGRRSRYRSSKHHAPGANHPDHPGCGALDLALDHADPWAQRPDGMSATEYEIARKNFGITGARAVRETILQVQKQFPDFRRPDGRVGTKFNRSAFYRIYSALRALQRHLDAETMTNTAG